MAKAGGPGFVDKHIEKVVLLGCLLVLLYALTQYGVSSKRTFEIGGQQDVAPKEIDTVLLDKAKRLEKLVEAQPAVEVAVRQDTQLLESMQNNPLPAPLPPDKQGYGVMGVMKLALLFGAPLQPKLTHIQDLGTQRIPTLAELEQVMPAPARPVCWSGTELMLREEPAADDEKNEPKLEEPATWRAVSWYPWSKLDDAWRKLLDSTIVESKLIALGYETEIQVKQPDGTWKTTSDIKPVVLPLYDSRSGEAIPPEPVPEYNGENGPAVQAWLDQFAKEGSEDLLQPDYYDVWIRYDQNPSWDVHFPADILKIYSLEELDDTKTKTASRSTRSSNTAISRYKAAARTTGAAARTTGAAGRTTARGGVQPPNYPMQPGAMPPGAFPPGAMPPGVVLPGGQPTAGRRTTTTRRQLTQPKTAAKKTADKEEKEIPVVEHPDIPDFQTQLAQGKVLLWFHANSLELGHEYRCRFRMVFANPLLTYDKDVEEENKKEAFVPSLKSKWSEWSEPVSVTRDVHFFLTGSFPAGNSITATVFTRWMDQELMYPISNIKAGQRIRGSRKVKFLNPLTSELMKDENGQDPVIEFDTGTVALQLNFGQTILVSGRPWDDVELVYLAPEGNLKSRSLYLDKNSQMYKDLEAQAKEASSAIEPDRPKKVKKVKETRKLLNPQFGPGGAGENPGDMGGPFEAKSRSRSGSSSSSGSSRSSSRSRTRTRD